MMLFTIEFPFVDHVFVVSTMEFVSLGSYGALLYLWSRVYSKE